MPSDEANCPYCAGPTRSPAALADTASVAREMPAKAPLTADRKGFAVAAPESSLRKWLWMAALVAVVLVAGLCVGRWTTGIQRPEAVSQGNAGEADPVQKSLPAARDVEEKPTARPLGHVETAGGTDPGTAAVLPPPMPKNEGETVADKLDAAGVKPDDRPPPPPVEAPPVVSRPRVTPPVSPKPPVDGAENAPPGDAKKAAEYFRLAVECMRLQDYEGAVKWCGDAIELDGRNVKFYLLRARAKGALNDNSGVIEDCKRITELDPKNIEAFGMRAYARLYDADPKSAIKDFTTAIRWDPKNGDWYRGRGQANEATDNHKSALSDYDTSLKLQPGNLGTLKLRAPVREKLGDLDGALDDIEQVVRARPNDKEAANLRDGLLDAIGEQEVAAGKRSWAKVRQEQGQQMVRRTLGEPNLIEGHRWWYVYDFAKERGWIDFSAQAWRVVNYHEPAWDSKGFQRGRKRGER